MQEFNISSRTLHKVFADLKLGNIIEPTARGTLIKTQDPEQLRKTDRILLAAKRAYEIASSDALIKTLVSEIRSAGFEVILCDTEQQSAADTIGDALTSGGFSVHLLDGITGSGKTQVYFDSAWRAYCAGKSVLLMMPEIALTAQFISRFESRFGAAPVVWHSNLTSARRREIWRGVLDGKIKMVVGTRSALFLPWQDLVW